MKWRIWVIVALLGASCAAPEAPDAWSVERLTPPEEEVEAVGVCADVRTLVLGSRAEESELTGTLSDLARIAATTGATGALPLLSDIGDLDRDSGSSSSDEEEKTIDEGEIDVRRHDLLVEASRMIDDRTAEACGVPAFSALYATTGFPECHFEMELPVAAYVVPSESTRCTLEGRPTFLPCWSDDGDHLAVDCVSGEIVQALGDRWAAAGEPRSIVIDRSSAGDAPEAISPVVSARCESITELFLDESSAPAIVGKLVSATQPLGTEVVDAATRFVAASDDPPSLDEFEALVSELDDATAAACGLPVVSALTALAPPVDELPCWAETGAAYPAYEVTDCP